RALPVPRSRFDVRCSMLAVRCHTLNTQRPTFNRQPASHRHYRHPAQTQEPKPQTLTHPSNGLPITPRTAFPPQPSDRPTDWELPGRLVGAHGCKSSSSPHHGVPAALECSECPSPAAAGRDHCHKTFNVQHSTFNAERLTPRLAVRMLVEKIRINSSVSCTKDCTAA